MKLKIAILPGDGIGPEIMKQGVAVLNAIAKKCGHTFEYEEAICGAHAIDVCGDPYPDATHDVCMRADAVLFAAVGDLKYDNDPTAKIRPEIERILKVAFEMAMKRNKHLTVVDKANVLASSRLWRQIAKEMEPQYPEVKTDYMFIDNASMRVLTEPRYFDVIVTENTFGDILTDETSCITGSMGLQPSSSLGEHTPLFEPVHGSWPQAAGQNLANPLAQILSAAMLLEHFGLQKEGALIREAVSASLDANVRTPDILELEGSSVARNQVEGGAKYGTKEVGEWIVNYIEKA